MNADHFRGRLMEWLAWASDRKNWRNSSEWCARHWAPCPVDGANGIAATVVLFKAALALMPADVLSAGGSAINSWKANQLVPTCCQLGDELVVEIWARVGPERA